MSVRSFIHVSYFDNVGGILDIEAGRLALGYAQVKGTGGSIRVTGAAGAVLDLTDGTTTVYSGLFGVGHGVILPPALAVPFFLR